MPDLVVEGFVDAPCPRAGLTVTGLSPGDQVVTVWRTSDGERQAVRGCRAVTVNDSLYVEDYEVPLGRLVTYTLEVLSGPDAGVQGVAGEVFVDSVSGYVQDPLDPSSAVPVRVGPRQEGRAVLAGSFSSMTYRASMSTFSVMGASLPVAISGVRGAASGVPFSVLTESLAENTRMRALVRGSALLLIRGLPSWGSRVPGAGVYAAQDVSENAKMPGDDVATMWEMTGDLVRASSARIAIASWTYQDVAELFATYEQKQAAAVGRSYLDVQKKPDG